MPPFLESSLFGARMPSSISLAERREPQEADSSCNATYQFSWWCLGGSSGDTTHANEETVEIQLVLPAQRTGGIILGVPWRMESIGHMYGWFFPRCTPSTRPNRQKRHILLAGKG